MALTDKINDGFIRLTNLLKTKVNKTDIIAITNGGTGATTASQARTNLGFGSATVNKQAFDVIGNNLINRYSGLSYVAYQTTYNVQTWESETLYQCEPETIVNLPIMPTGTRSTLTFFHANNFGVVTLQVPIGEGNFIYHPATGLGATNKQLQLKPAEQVELLNRGGGEWDVIGGSYLNRVSLQNIETQSIKSGLASYKKGWRKLTETMPSSAGSIKVAHGATKIGAITANVTCSDGSIVQPNFYVDVSKRFYLYVNTANQIEIGVDASATQLFGKTIEIFVDEQL